MGNKLIVGVNDLKTWWLQNKKECLLDEWDFEKNLEEHLLNVKHPKAPEDISKGSKIKVFWKCQKCGYEWRARIDSRVVGNGCRNCASEYKTSFPEKAIIFYLRKVTDVIEQYNVSDKMAVDCFLPDYNIAIEYDGVYWHKDKTRYYNKNTVCNDKEIKLIHITEGDMDFDTDKSVHHIFLKEDFSYKELEHIICELLYYIDINFNISIDLKTDMISIYNTYIKNSKSLNVLNAFPDIAAEWHPTMNQTLRPDMFAPQSNKRVWWLGRCGHTWDDTISHRTTGKRGCPYCSGKRVLPGFNDLKTKNPKLAKEFHNNKNGELNAYDFTANSHKEVWWQCSQCGHEWKAQIKARNQGKYKCPKCKGQYHIQIDLELNN